MHGMYSRERIEVNVMAEKIFISVLLIISAAAVYNITKYLSGK